MDLQSIQPLATAAVSLIVQYLAKAGDRAARQAGQAIFDAVAARLQEKAGAQETLAELEQSPEDQDMQAALRVELRRLLAEDEAFAAQLRQLVGEAPERPGQTTIISQTARDNATQIGQARDVDVRK